MTRALARMAAAAAAATTMAHAAPFADPTRPPAALEGGQGEPAAAAGPRLESVLIAPDRRIAVISGRQVTLGSRIGDGRVVRITESEVRIRRPAGEETLRLFATQGRRPSASGKGK